MKIATYDTNLTDAQWAYLKPMLPQPAKRGRPPKDRRRIMDAILYLVKCGCPWRYLPADFPNWKTVYHVFRQWVHNHQWAALNDALRLLVRKTHDKRGRPTAAILDSQSVKSAGHGGPVGYDAGKRIRSQTPSAGGYFGAGARRDRDPSQHHRARRSPNAFGPRSGLVHLAAHLVGG